jgi:hypothetical protein
VFPFRPTCSSIDSERNKTQKVSKKGPEKKAKKCGKLGLTGKYKIQKTSCIQKSFKIKKK